ncbi:MAG TPA: hypothetical protein VIF62_20425, partial [Labilithrix sp.]
MAKFQSPLLGYNNNVRHKNRVFHIQTEDSGVNHPHIITHLFMDGGRILKSVKKSYAEHVGADGMSETVRNMMKEQHKAMFIALRDGQFDHLVDYGNAAPAAAPSETTKTAPKPAPSEPIVAPPSTNPEQAPATIDESRRIAAAAAAAQPSPSAIAMPASEQVPTTMRDAAPPAVSQKEPAGPALTLDFDALESGASDDGSLFRANDLPPPPKNLFS